MVLEGLGADATQLPHRSSQAQVFDDEPAVVRADQLGSQPVQVCARVIRDRVRAGIGAGGGNWIGTGASGWSDMVFLLSVRCGLWKRRGSCQ